MWTRVKVFDARRKMTFWQKVGFCLNATATIPALRLAFVMRGVVTVFVLWQLWLNAAEIRQHPAIAIALSGWWAMAGAVFRPVLLCDAHRRLFPLTLDRLFADELKARVIGVLWLFVELATVYGLALNSYGSSMARWTVVIFASLVQCAVSLSATAAIMALRLNPSLLVFPLLIVAFGLPFTTPEGPLGVFFLNPVFGWVNEALWNGVVQGHPNALLMALPAFAIVGTLPFSLRSVRRQHDAGLLYDPARANCQTWRFPIESTESREQAPIDFPTLVQKSSRSWSGMIDRLLSRLLTARDRNILEILEIEPVTFTRRYWKVLFYCALFGAINLFIPDLKSMSFTDALAQLVVSSKNSGAAPGVLPPSVRVLGLVLATFLPFMLALWAIVVVFVKVVLFELSLVNSPETSRRTDLNSYNSFRLFPVNRWEVEVAVFKTATIFMFLLIPPAALVSVCPVSEIFVRSIEQSPMLMIKAPILIWLIMVSGSGVRLLPWGGGEWKKFVYTWRNLVLMMFFIGIAAVFGFAPSPWDWVLGPIVVAIVLLWFAWCGRGYRRDWKRRADFSGPCPKKSFASETRPSESPRRKDE